MSNVPWIMPRSLPENLGEVIRGMTDLRERDLRDVVRGVPSKWVPNEDEVDAWVKAMTTRDPERIERVIRNYWSEAREIS